MVQARALFGVINPSRVKYSFPAPTPDSRDHADTEKEREKEHEHQGIASIKRRIIS